MQEVIVQYYYNLFLDKRKIETSYITPYPVVSLLQIRNSTQSIILTASMP